MSLVQKSKIRKGMNPYARQDRNEQVKKLRIAGLTFEEIALEMGISRQRVHQIAKKLLLKSPPRSFVDIRLVYYKNNNGACLLQVQGLYAQQTPTGIYYSWHRLPHTKEKKAKRIIKKYDITHFNPYSNDYRVGGTTKGN